MVQINMNRCETASHNLLTILVNDIALIQEPWIFRDRVLGLSDAD